MKTFLILTLLASLSAFADINIKDGSFVKTWKDTQFLQRTYRSRSLFSGFFGYGWCSNLEKYLLPRPNGDLILKDCSLDNDILLSRTKVGAWSFRGIILVLEKKPGVFQLSQNVGPNKRLLTFNSTGKLLGDGQNRFLYTDGLIREIIDQKNRHWKVHWDDDHRRILSIKNKQTFSYSYDNDNLIKTEIDEQTQFTYDSFHNLTKIQVGLEKLLETVTYDSHLDLVTSLRDSTSECVQIFEYKSADEFHSQTLLRIQCGIRPPKLTKYEFQYRKLPLGTHVLTQMTVLAANKTRTFQFNPLTGEANQIKTKIRIGEINE